MQWEEDRPLREGACPAVIIDPTEGDAGLVGSIRQALSRFSYADPQCCNENLLIHYRAIAAYGTERWQHELLPNLFSQLSAHGDDVRQAINETVFNVVTHLGQWLFEQLPHCYTENPLPDYFYRVAFAGNELIIGFRFLDTVKDTAGRAYLPAGKKTVAIAGCHYQVALYRHAVEQMLRRMRMTPVLNYAQSMNIYTLLTTNALHFTHVPLTDNADALRVAFEIPTIPGVSAYYDLYVKEILGEENLIPNGGRLYAVAGYLPITIQHGYARAKTFLFPGYAKTPERRLFTSQPDTPELRRLRRTAVEENTFADVFAGTTLDFMKWYHLNGVPQVFYEDVGRHEMATD